MTEEKKLNYGFFEKTLEDLESDLTGYIDKKSGGGKILRVFKERIV